MAGAAETNFEAVSGMPQPDSHMTIVSDDAYVTRCCHTILALVSHDACCMWHECPACCNAATVDQKSNSERFEAFIRTDERTMLSYLFKPLTDQARRAFREK